MSINKDKYSIENTDYSVGQDNVEKWGFDVHNRVFALSAGLILFFLVAILLSDASTANTVLNDFKWQVINNFDGLFLWAGNIFLFFCLFLIVSPYGRIRLGGEQSETEYSMVSWLSMLFAAGMGIGLIFWGVAEPTAFFTGWGGTPLGVEAYSIEAKKVALGATIFHWGLHAWSFYGVMALALAFFFYNKGLPLSVRSIFYPIVGDRTWGWFGNIIDVMTVLVTIFGMATSLGLGSKQAATGLNHLFGTDYGLGLQFAVIVFVTSLAIVSIVRGMQGGVRILSNTNICIAFCFLIFMGCVGFSSFVSSLPLGLVGYIENIIPLSNPHGRGDEGWMQGWTVFYWAWWVTCAPFVGIFIARISKGRTIREFLSAVIFIPSVVCIFWMTILGGIAIDQVMNGIGELGANGITDVSLALFQLIDALPFSYAISAIAVVLIMIFFITTSDSASLVLDSITSGGKIDTPTPQRVFWSVVSGSIAAVLVWIGGTEAIEALQAGTIITALPFTFVLLLICVSLMKGLSTEPRPKQVKAATAN
ncbi:BCCT family transporter [Photobacterium minamisatsumaniensis]|uniref:BCCT family transporter n=1 Tax=Photobacterium minamisatsumaniensis TaxID=2910233 RepID=UPI003D096B72